MRHLKRHALGLGIILFIAGAFLTVAPVSASGFGCGSAIWPKDDTVRTADTVAPDGQVLNAPLPADLEARADCHHKRQTQTTVAVSLGVAGLIGVFWSVVAAPETTRRRNRQGLLTGR
ncbi:MAG TPA: hypothetical protein VMQ81_08250 [Acidimicrobiia bacterium]|nr:hypothetical protein [Acidimicrobiia bacterium]